MKLFKELFCSDKRKVSNGSLRWKLFKRKSKTNGRHPGQLTTTQLDEIRCAFARLDKNGDGYIDMIEMAPLVTSLGYDGTSTKDCQKLLYQFDSDMSGVLEFHEFVKLIVQKFEFTKEKSFMKRKNNSSAYDHSHDNHSKIKRVEMLTDDQLDMIKIAFAKYDRDCSGSINKKELVHLMRALGQNPTEKEVSDMIIELDEDKSGQLEFLEFLNMMTQKFYDFLNPDQEMKQVFEVFDKDGDGILEIEEFRSVMRENKAIDLSELDDMFAMADINQDGCLDYKEFVAMISEHLGDDEDDDDDDDGM